MPAMSDLAQRILEAVPAARYVAVYRDGQLQMSSREGLANPSSSESDKCEELLVNPAVTKLLRQRGDIDCGGFEYVIVRYGNFYQFVEPVAGGHVSVALEPDARIDECVALLRQVIGAA